jgi:hypothetical protein
MPTVLREVLVGTGCAIAGGLGVAIFLNAVQLPAWFAEDRARISHLEEQVKALSAPDLTTARCAEFARRLAEANPTDVWVNIPQLREAMRLVCGYRYK